MIDITGSGANTLKLSTKDVLDMSGAVDLVAITGLTHRHELFIKGNSGDAVILSDVSSWSHASGTVTYDGVTYEVWNSTTTLATLLVQQGVTPPVVG